MLWVYLRVIGTFHPQSKKVIMGVKTKAIGDSKLIDSLGLVVVHLRPPMLQAKSSFRVTFIHLREMASEIYKL